MAVLGWLYRTDQLQGVGGGGAMDAGVYGCMCEGEGGRAEQESMSALAFALIGSTVQREGANGRRAGVDTSLGRRKTTDVFKLHA